MTTAPEGSGRCPLFTVIIPTANRAEVLRHTLRTCSMQNYEPLEVIVADDCSTDATRDVVEEAARRDPRIRYTAPAGRIGMRANFEFALNQVRPGFVVALGGDDGLLPDGISGMNEVRRATGLKLFSWAAPVYSYPQVKELPNGQLMLFHPTRSRIVNSAEFLRRQAIDLSYIHDLESPMFYGKGAASTTLIDSVKSRSRGNEFYSSPTPDGYSGIVLAGEVSHFAFSAKPFTIYGLSKASQGLAYLSDEEEARAASKQFFKDVSSRPMHHELASQPYSPLITLMTVDFLLTARDLPGWPGLVPTIDFRSVLKKSVAELENTGYGQERLCRELRILHHVAIRHGLEPFFRRSVRRASRRAQRAALTGTGVNRKTIYVDGAAYNIHNIFDAAYVARALCQMAEDWSVRTLFRSGCTALVNRLRATRRISPFPAETEWSGAALEGIGGGPQNAGAEWPG